MYRSPTITLFSLNQGISNVQKIRNVGMLQMHIPACLCAASKTWKGNKVYHVALYNKGLSINMSLDNETSPPLPHAHYSHHHECEEVLAQLSGRYLLKLDSCGLDRQVKCVMSSASIDALIW